MANIAPPVPAPAPALAPIATAPSTLVQVLGTDSEVITPVPPSEQPEVPAPVNTLPATPELPMIEPTPLPAPMPIATAPSGGDKVVQFLTAQNEVKLLSLLAILSLLLSVMFLLTRGGIFSVPVAMRTFVLLVLFSYIAIFGVGQFSMSAIPSPPAAQIVGSM